MDVKASFMTYLDQLKRSSSDPSLAKDNTAAMACEGCAQKFTVFKRKKLCNICLRHFCAHCLSPQLGPGTAHSVLARLTDRRHICGTCVVLTARPLCRLQLRRLKVKDLQHYLTAQRVSTRGCVEKDDLVNLLIRHVGSSNGGATQDSVCHSHQDLSGGADGCPQPNVSGRPPAPPRNFPHPPATSTFASATASSSVSSTAAPGNGGGFRIPSQRPDGTSMPPSTPSVPTPMDTSPSVEIVELSEDWAGDTGAEAPGDGGPEPLVEEISDSAAGASASCPTSPASHLSLDEANTLSSSTTSLGDPNPSSSHSHSPSNTSSPPPSHSNSHSPTHRQAPEQEERAEGTPLEEVPTASASSEPSGLGSDMQSVRPAVITLNTIKTLEELEKLPIKQIKDLLMRNRVDFRGCCERTELVERATRLWVENQEAKKAFEQLGATEMCKVCMDAPIECVMLECGHMATCMSCGKQLSECPLCRQYVVRVVRIFRA